MTKQEKKALIYVAYHLESPEIIGKYVETVKTELESRGYTVAIARDAESASKEIVDADIMVCWRITPEIFAHATKLKWIQFGSAGIDHTIFPALLTSDVTLTNLSGVHKTPVAEHVMGLMLAMSRKLDVAIRQQSEHRYDRSTIAPVSEELYDKTVGILGLGKIGLEIARLCKCFGMRVIGTKRHPEQLEHVDKVYPPEWLDDVLKESDYLAIVLPLTGNSSSLIGRREIGLMKPTSRIINVGRGPMIDYDALLDALRSLRLAGVALDVFHQEPLPEDSPLFDLPNVIITPHVAGAHDSYWRRAFEIFSTNLNAFESNEPMINVFDRSLGY